ncbi:hypothetical protein [Gaetbulibacter jejuensis]|uniref:Uncharacterized protein n=1 Tax=Gaetbulibacter jejuensis TaxID=584607 RepID=A0ABP3UN82_9FLAO
MGVDKYSENIIIPESTNKVFEICINIIKKMFYNVQYINEEKTFLVAKNVSANFGPAGVIIIIDAENEDPDKTKLIITSTNLTDVTVNFNRNVKTVNKLIKKLNKEFTI